MDSLEIKKELEMSYQELVCYLLSKYGKAEHDYFTSQLCSSVNKRVSRSSEGLFCHHIDEDKAIMLSSIRYARKNSYEYQKAGRLVYCNLIEHLLLHVKIVIEPKAVGANENENQGIGGIVNFISKTLNDLYDGYISSKDYIKIAFEMVKDNYEDYINILRYLLDEMGRDNKKSQISLKKQLSRGFRKNMVLKVYERLIKVNESDLLDEEYINGIHTLAAHGVVDKQALLGFEYRLGKYLEYNPELSFYWTKRAAENDHLYSTYMLYFYYINGYGTDKNVDEAFICLCKAANNGHSKAQLELYYQYKKQGKFEEGIKWLQSSAQNGYIEAQRELGYFFYNKRNSKKTMNEAVKWLEQAAEQGDKLSIKYLADIYANSKYVETNLIKANKYRILANNSFENDNEMKIK